MGTTIINKETILTPEMVEQITESKQNLKDFVNSFWHEQLERQTPGFFKDNSIAPMDVKVWYDQNAQVWCYAIHKVRVIKHKGLREKVKITFFRTLSIREIEEKLNSKLNHKIETNG